MPKHIYLLNGRQTCRQFFEEHFATVYTLQRILTGMDEKEVLTEIAVAIVNDMWANRARPFQASSREGIVYHFVLKHLIAYLKHAGQPDEIEPLTKICRINQALAKKIGMFGCNVVSCQKRFKVPITKSPATTN